MLPAQDNMRPGLIDVAVALPVFSTFTYLAPVAEFSEVVVGTRVLVPFGHRRVTGYVVQVGGQPPDVKIKPIVRVLDDQPLFPESMIAFFQWVADYYVYPIGEVIQAALPAGLNVSDKIVFELTRAGQAVLSTTPLSSREKTLFELLQNEACSMPYLRRTMGNAFPSHVLKRWEQKQWLVRRHSLTGGRTKPKTARFVSLGLNHQDGDRLSATRQAILHLLAASGSLSMADLKSHFPTAAQIIPKMAKDRQVVVEDRTVYRDPLGMPVTPDHPPRLNKEQDHAVETVGRVLGQGFQTFLLAGVTGSGKTEVYLHLTAKALNEGMSVLVLVPEIALVSQLERAFRARFGGCIALLHSGLSDGERFDQWQRIRSHHASIAIGARSAIFAPFANIGLIIVDEEHDDSYKQEGRLRYNARDMAVVRARQLGAVAVLGSATPSLQSAYNARNGKFTMITLNERIDGQVMPEIIVKDLTAVREERGLRRFLTPALMKAVADTLARKEQVLIFLNRRGFANSLVCADCGQPLCCEHCDISLTYHQQRNAYQCHYCGYSQSAVTRCKKCGSKRVLRLGVGTEKLEDEVKKLFPAARVSRMDRDTTRRKGSLLKILRALRDRKIDILIGTQMVAKGHDYPGITLVGIICADLSLGMPDFRAGERTFQLLAQVAGRAGRGQVPGRVILQTYNPLHFSIEAARKQDFEAFYRQEIEFRKALGYPPVTRMIQVRINGRDKANVSDYAMKMGELGRYLLKNDSFYRELQMLGPIEAPLSRIANQYRWQILVKGVQVNPLHRFVHQLLFGPDGMAGNHQVSVSIDVDPVFLM